MKDRHFVRLKIGLLEHCEAGEMTPTMFCVYATILAQARYETGFWIGSAGKIYAAWGGQLPLRTIQDSLAALYAKKYLKSFHKRGERGNYPVAIEKYEIRFGKYKGYRLNADATTAPNSPVYEPVEYEDQRNDRAITAQSPRNHRAKTPLPNARILDVIDIRSTEGRDVDEREQAADAALPEAKPALSPVSTSTAGADGQVGLMLGERGRKMAEQAGKSQAARRAEEGGQVESDARLIEVEMARKSWPLTTKVSAVIRDELRNGRLCADILKAITSTMGDMPDGERLPGLFLAQNLVANITLLDVQKTERAEHAATEKRWIAEQRAKSDAEREARRKREADEETSREQERKVWDSLGDTPAEQPVQ